MDEVAASIPPAAFAVLTRRAGLDLTEAQLDVLYGVYGHFEAMLTRLRSPSGTDRARGAEPAHIFVPGQEWGA